MAGNKRGKRDPEREALVAALKEVAASQAAPHAAASFWTGVVVLATWLLLAGGSCALLLLTRDVRLAEGLGRVLGFPTLLLWAASAFGLVKGVLGLVQRRGKKAMAVGGSLLNGLLCLGPVAAILA